MSEQKKMNLPNRLTVLRILLVPVFILFMLWRSIPAAPLQSRYTAVRNIC